MPIGIWNFDDKTCVVTATLQVFLHLPEFRMFYDMEIIKFQQPLTTQFNTTKSELLVAINNVIHERNICHETAINVGKLIGILNELKIKVSPEGLIIYEFINTFGRQLYASFDTPFTNNPMSLFYRNSNDDYITTFNINDLQDNQKKLFDLVSRTPIATAKPFIYIIYFLPEYQKLIVNDINDLRFNVNGIEFELMSAIIYYESHVEAIINLYGVISRCNDDIVSTIDSACGLLSECEYFIFRVTLP